MWDSGVIVDYIWGTFDLVELKVILDIFGAIDSKWPVTHLWYPIM